MTEHQGAEFKSAWRDEYLKWICGFANAHGGVLEIGRGDDGCVVGLADAERLLAELPNKIRDLLGIVVDVDLRTEGGRSYLRITVEPHPHPISFRGEYHYRSGSTKQVLRGAALERFLLGKQGRHWDGVPVPHASCEDLDPAVVGTFRRLATTSRRLSTEMLQEPDHVLVERLRLTEGSFLKRAAVLLFLADPERFVSGAFVKVGRFRTDADLAYHDEVHGSLFTQATETMDLLLTKYLQAAISYDGVQRIETLPIPEEALREAVLNAIAHKDYGCGIPIQISVYDDRIILWNPGHLPPDWTVERLAQKHASYPFNPEVANTLFRAGLIEAWGRGYERMASACRAADRSAPTVRCDQTGLWVEFRFPPAPCGETAEGGGTKEMTREKTQEITKEKTGDEAAATARAKILEIIQAKPRITARELAERLGRSLKGVEWNIRKLKRMGVLMRVGSARDGHWTVSGDAEP